MSFLTKYMLMFNTHVSVWGAHSCCGNTLHIMNELSAQTQLEENSNSNLWIAATLAWGRDGRKPAYNFNNLKLVY